MPDYRQGTVRGGQQFSAVSGFLNLKKQFEYAKMHNQWEQEKDWRNSLSKKNEQNVQSATTLASNGMMNPDQFKSATSSVDPYSGQQVPGMEISEGQRKLSPSIQNAKDKRTQDVLTSIEEHNTQRDSINDALSSAKKIGGGIYGKLSRSALKNLDPNNPALEDWQKVKMVLTDAQLMQSMLLKGSISDTENKWLAQAAANDDVAALPRILPVLNRFMKTINAKEKGLVGSYKKIYGEDPYSWGDNISNISQYENMDGNSKSQSSGFKIIKVH